MMPHRQYPAAPPRRGAGSSALSNTHKSTNTSKCLVPSIHVCPCVLTHTHAGVLSSAAAAELVFPAELISPARFTASFSVQPRCASIWLSLSPGRVEGAGDGWQSTAHQGLSPDEGLELLELSTFPLLRSSKMFSLRVPIPPSPSSLPPPKVRGLALTLLHPRDLPSCQLGTRPTRVHGFLCSCRTNVKVTQLRITPSLSLGLLVWSRGD